MSGHSIRLSRVKAASHNLHSGKVKIKHESVELLLDYLNEQDVLDALNEDEEEWVNLFIAVKEALYREIKKVEDKLVAGKIAVKDELHANNCRDLLAKVVKSANAIGAKIPYKEYLLFLKRCMEDVFLKKYCLFKCLNTLNKNILDNEEYWPKFTLDDVMHLLQLFKEIHTAGIDLKALQCYLTLIKTAVNYMLTPEILFQEREFIREVIVNIQSSNICWILETSAELFLIFCQVCGPIYNSLCIRDGEDIIVHLFCFYQPYGSFTEFKMILFQLCKQHLEYHSDLQAGSNKWRIALKKIGTFIKSLVEKKDELFMLPSNHAQCTTDFTIIAALYYSQAVNIELLHAEETPSKRAKVEPHFIEILQNIEKNLQDKWLLVFTEILRIRPQVLNVDYYNRLVPFLTNYVKESKSTILRGSALNCLCVLLTIESSFNRSDRFNENWKSLYKSTIRTLGLNQNVPESNSIVRELMQRKHELIRNESHLLLNLYISRTVSISPDAILTLKVFGSIFNIFSNETKVQLLNYIIPEKIDVPTNAFTYFGYDATAEIVANITFKNWIKKEADVKIAIMINNDVCLELITLLWRLTKEAETCTKLDKLLSFTYFLLGMVFEYRQTGDTQFISEIETITNCVIRVGLMPQLSHFFETFNTNNDKFTNDILLALRSLLYVDMKVNDIVRNYIDDNLVEKMTTSFGSIECKSANRDDPMLKIKLSMIRALNTYALRSRTEYEEVLKSVLFDFNEFSITDKTEYVIIMTMIEGLAEDDIVMNQDAFESVLSLIQKIINEKSDDYKVMLDLISIFKNIFKLAIKNSILPDLLSLFKTMHFKRYNFGVKVHIALAECFEVLSRVDDNGTRAILNGDHILVFVVDYLDSNYSDVHDVVFRTIMNLFSRNVKDHSLVLLKREMLKTIKRKLISIHVGITGVTKSIFEKTAMELITNIIISSKKDEFTKNALCELFISWKTFNIEENILHNAIETIRSTLNHFSLNEHLKLLFNSWMKHHCILDFPYKLLNCKDKKEFFKNHMEIFTSLSYDNYQYQYDIICDELGLTQMEIEEQCFSNLIAKKIANEIQGIQNGFSGEPISQPKKEDILSNIDDILINMLQYVYDADDFQNMFENIGSLPVTSEVFLSRKNFQNDIVEHLFKYTDCNLWEVIFKNPLKLHKILLELKKNMIKKSSVDDKIVEFYRYVICTDEIIKYTQLKQDLCKFVIRNVIYFLINLINREDAVIMKYALKYLCKFIDFCVASENAAAFADYVIITCSCVTPLAIENDQNALNTLSKIILADNEIIEEKLQYLDPLQSDCDHIQPLREHHLRLRGNNTLENEMKLFLSEEQFKNSRTEGLIHLRKCLNDDTGGLKDIYLQLNDIRGKLSKDSIIHALICKLLELLKSTDKREADEALRCLGIIGAKDLTTMVLKSEQKTFKKKDTLWNLFVRKVAECMADYLVDYDMDLAKHATDALIALGTVEECSSIRTSSDVRLKSILSPFLETQQSKNTQKYITFEFPPHIADSSLWCPDIEISHSDWIIQLVTKLLDSIVNNDFINVVKLIVAKRVEFAEICFPFALSLILDLPDTDLILSAIESFFKVHILCFEKNNTQSITMNQTSIKCVLNALHYIELLKPEGKIRKNINLNLNYLDIARAAQYCSRFFTALMYGEKWYHNNTLEIMGLEMLDTFRAIVQDAYNAIGDKDALYGGHLVSDAYKRQILSSNQNHDFLLLHRELNVRDSLPDFANSLRDHALYNASLLISKRHEIFNDTLYECAWRLGQWNEPIRDELSGFESHVYSILNAFNDKDELSFNRWLLRAREEIANDLKNISMESCTVLYGPLSKLERLQEVEDIFKVRNHSNNIPTLIKKFESKDKIFTDFNYYEPRVAQRITAFGILQGGHIAGAEDYYNAMRLNLADLARREGRKHIAQAIINDLQTIEESHEDIQAKATLIDVQLSWATIHSIDYLKNTLNTYRTPNRLRAELLKTCGEWIAEKNLQSPKKILKDYFLESLEIQNNQEIPDANEIAELFKVMAMFSDDYYQTLMQQIKSPEFVEKLKHLRKMKEKVESLKNIKNCTEDMRKSRIIHERLTKIDEIEILRKRDELKLFLKFAFKYYLHYLRFSENSKIQLFRIFALLLESRRNVELIRSVEAKLLEINSYKLLIILPQLIPHIATDEDVFSLTIFKLIESCAIKHPHHTIPLILAVLNTELDNKYTKDNTSSNEARIKGAEKLIGQLENNSNLKDIISENMIMSDAIIELAYYKSKEESKASSIRKIPRHMKIVSIKNFNHCLLPTYTLPVQPLGNYDYIIGIHKFSPSFGAVGGINVPKRIECIGTDGIKRPQLVKGKDDLRQDAVMQQVFSIMNDLLRENKETRNLLIRTYKVVPLSKCSGLLEWVENSMPINEYLIDAHKRYYPSDMDPDVARGRLATSANENDSPEKRLHIFKIICGSIRPVFHKFFETNFLEPTVWYERRRAYTESVATSSMCGYILGIGDRHLSNILIDKSTAEVIHIDFGIAFEQGLILPTPETVPFRLSRDIVDGIGVCGIEGTFRWTCEKTMDALRRNSITILTILDVLLYDPLYAWSITPMQAYNKQVDAFDDRPLFQDNEREEINTPAARALNRLKEKLDGMETGKYLTVETQVQILIQKAMDSSSLAKLYHGWAAYL